VDATIVSHPFEVDRVPYLNVVFRRRMGRRLLRMLAVLLVVMALNYFLVGPVGMLYSAGLLLLVIIVMPLVLYLITRIRYASPKFAPTFQSRVIEANEEGIRVKTQSGITSQVPWSNFTSAEQSGDFLLLFFTPIQHFIVSLGAFDSQDRQAFLKLVGSKLKIGPVSLL